MKSFRELLIRMGYKITRSDVIKFYDQFQRYRDISLKELREQQNQQLRSIVAYCFKNVPYYKEMFKKLGLTAGDIQEVSDLRKLPVMTKEEIKNNPSFYPTQKMSNYIQGSTGGSTGAPLKYRMSAGCYSRGLALLYRGWGFAGYKLGDKVAIIAGASLTSSKEGLKSRLADTTKGMRHYSSYGMSEQMLDKYFKDMKKWQPKFLRGYASSLFLLAKFVKTLGGERDISLVAIFSTAEMLLPAQKSFISEVFGLEVFDTYGLNDGGVSAFECHKHDGMHIDMERSILECVDKDGNPVYNTRGRLLATSLFNYDMPFIRYDTGDFGIISNQPCSCGCPRPLLKQLLGRETDYLKLKGKFIGSPVLTVLMGKMDVQQYQIIQKGSAEVTIRIVKGPNYSQKDEEFIRNSLSTHVDSLAVHFEYIDSFPTTEANKHKFIINEVCP